MRPRNILMSPWTYLFREKLMRKSPAKTTDFILMLGRRTKKVLLTLKSPRSEVIPRNSSQVFLLVESRFKMNQLTSPKRNVVRLITDETTLSRPNVSFYSKETC